MVEKNENYIGLAIRKFARVCDEPRRWLKLKRPAGGRNLTHRRDVLLLFPFFSITLRKKNKNKEWSC